MESNLLEALKYIDVSSLSYSEWISVGMALKEEGYDWSTWDNWSRGDTRYKSGECQRKWESFSGSSTPIKGGTIVDMAKVNGYNPRSFDGDGCLEWDSVIEYDGSGTSFEIPNTQKPTEQLINYLQILFKDDDLVSYVASDVWQDKDGKWMPSRGVSDRSAKQLIESLKKHPEDLGATLGDWKEECGAWIRFNPVDGKGIKNENITRFDYALVESDTMPLAEQDAMYRRLELPIACLVNSGGKSLHAIVKVEAKDYEEYRKRVDFLYNYLEKKGLIVDKQNRNPSRLSRLPGVTRNGNTQTLIDTNIGRKSWIEWMDFVEGLDDELPSLTYLADALKNPIVLPEELIYGVLRRGHKMIVAGSSKAGKSFLLMELALALSSGKQWVGFKCKKSKVLYVNLEIDSMSCINRFKVIMDALKMKPEDADNITIWNLRGKALPMDKLVPKLIRRIQNQGYSAVIIDPIYKVITGDENNASEMGQFCNQFDKICNETGCSTIYCHHHSKGMQGSKNMIDRSSGSGVFARDLDAIIDLIQLEVDKEFILKNAASEYSTAWQIEGTLREFQGFKPVKCWFDYPIHKLDSTGILDSQYAQGSEKGNLSKSGKRKQTPESRKEEFDSAFDACLAGKNYCTAEELAEYLDVGVRTIQKRVVEFADDYIIAKGNVHKNIPMPKTKKGKKSLSSESEE